MTRHNNQLSSREAEMLAWLEVTWPDVGTGSDFNQGVIRGWEIIKAQIENGYLRHIFAPPPELLNALNWALNEIRCPARSDNERKFWDRYDAARATLTKLGSIT